MLLGVALAAAFAPSPALAQPRSGAAASADTGGATTDDQRKAQEHFQRAKELYSTGRYSEAITELEVARGLDPKARDLVMNLGIVHEKLGKYDEAITWLRTLLDMEGVTPAERAKAEGMIKRIEGAKASAPSPSPTSSGGQTTAPPQTPPEGGSEGKTEPPPRGRIDTLTITAGSVAAVGLVLGTGLGIYALSSRPGNDFVTGRDGSYATLEQRSSDAHTVAIVADVSLGIGVVAAAATAWLYFSRPKVQATTPTTGKATSRLSVSPTSVRSGGGVLIGGTF
jgi:hypothetical protein